MSTYYQPRTYDSTVVTPTDPSAPPLPVVVVGAGPVGMAVALGLARRGTPVTVLEAANQVSFGSRAICISRHTLEVCDRLGVGDALTDLVLPWHGGRSFYRDQEVLHFRMPHEQDAVRDPMVNVSQSELEQVMVDALLAEPLVTFCWGAAVTGSRQDGDQVLLDVDTVQGTRQLRASWVVAADGGRSRMRDLTGVALRGTSYEGRYVIADIHWQSSLPAERMVWFDPPSNPGSTVIMHRQPGDIWRIDYQLDPTEDAEVETQESRIRARITNHLDWLQNDLPWTLEWHGFYKAHALALDDFVAGRVLFAGDAAHLVPIFGVRGLNSGMEDAETLVWMLGAVLTGSADTRLLSAYGTERRHAWEQNVANAGKSTLIMTPGTHGYRTTRDAVLALATTNPQFSHLINPRQSSATHARTSPLTVTGGTASALQPGDPLEDRRVRLSSGKQTSLNEVRGNGFAVLAVEPDAATLDAALALRDELDTAFPAEDVVLAVTSRSGEQVTRADATPVDTLDDADGRLAAAWDAGPGEVLVVRPDGLLLTRGVPSQLDGLVPHVLSAGDEPQRGATAEPQVSVPVDQARREAAWLTVSEGIDAVSADDREGFLARLALLLADQVAPEQLQQAADAAVSAR